MSAYDILSSEECALLCHLSRGGLQLSPEYVSSILSDGTKDALLTSGVLIQSENWYELAPNPTLEMVSEQNGTGWESIVESLKKLDDIGSLALTNITNFLSGKELPQSYRLWAAELAWLRARVESNDTFLAGSFLEESLKWGAADDTTEYNRVYGWALWDMGKVLLRRPVPYRPELSASERGPLSVTLIEAGMRFVSASGVISLDEIEDTFNLLEGNALGEEALRIFGSTLKAGGAFAQDELTEFLGRLLLERFKPAEAFDLLKEFDSPKLLALRAEAAEMLGMAKEAAASYYLLAFKETENPSAWFYLAGKNFLQARDLKNAKDALRLASSTPVCYYAQADLVRVSLLEGNDLEPSDVKLMFEGLEGELRKPLVLAYVETLWAKNLQLEAFKALLEESKNGLELSEELFELALEINTQEVWHLLNVAQISFDDSVALMLKVHQGQLEDADFEKLQKLPIIIPPLVNTLVAQSKLRDAARALEDNERYYFMRAELLIKLNHLRQARETLVKALSNQIPEPLEAAAAGTLLLESLSSKVSLAELKALTRALERSKDLNGITPFWDGVLTQVQKSGDREALEVCMNALSSSAEGSALLAKRELFLHGG